MTFLSIVVKQCTAQCFPFPGRVETHIQRDFLHFLDGVAIAS